MSQPLTPDAILSDVINGKINVSLAVDLLLSHIEKSDNEELRSDCILTLYKLDIPKEKIEKTYQTVESCLLTDENQFVRNSAVFLIANKLLEYGLKALSWSIQHDSSPLVINTLIKIFLERNPNISRHLTNLLKTWLFNYASNIGITPQESLFFLEIECLFANQIKNYFISEGSYSYFQFIMNIKSNSFIYINNRHVKKLHFNFYYWLYLRKNQDIINSFTKVKDLGSILSLYKRYDLQFKELNTVPTRIGNLTYLEVLDLSSNGINAIPFSIFSLSKLRVLDLSNNNIRVIPKSIKKLNQLKVLKLNDNNLDTIPSNIEKYLNSLDTFQY